MKSSRLVKLYGEDYEVPEFPREVIIRRQERLRELLQDDMDIHYTERTQEIDSIIKERFSEIERLEAIND